MIKKIFFRILLYLLLTFGLKAYSQYTNIPLGYNFNNFLGAEIHQKINHTSFKPLITNSVNINIDSLIESNFYSDNRILSHRFFNKHLMRIKGQDYLINASLISNLALGCESYDSKNTFTNTRGFLIDGYIGDKLSFQTSFVENQSVFPNYVDSLIRTPTQGFVIPGQGRGRTYYDGGFDYSKSSGFLSFEASKNITIQFGHGKHFIGDGYRSLLLSDNSFNYPFLRLRTHFGKFEYSNLYAELQDMKNYLSYDNGYDYMGYAKKYMSSHFLSYSVNSKLSLGIYESVIWKNNHTLGANGFDINYLNPIIFFRPVEFSINSPDNMLIGLNLKYKLTSRSFLFSQVVLDEFTINEFKTNNGYWGNKYGYQIGYKCFDFLNLPNLTIHLEQNYVRPLTYSHWNNSSYGHYNEELAHPLGANFIENIIILNYRMKRITTNLKYIQAKYGADYLGDTISYGSNIYLDYNNRPGDYGINMFNGNKTDLKFTQFNLGYILNPTTNLKLEFSLVSRILESETNLSKTLFYSFSLRSDLFNHYYDF